MAVRTEMRSLCRRCHLNTRQQQSANEALDDGILLFGRLSPASQPANVAHDHSADPGFRLPIETTSFGLSAPLSLLVYYL